MAVTTVLASLTSNQSLAALNTFYEVSLGNKITDTLSEFNTSTYTFTAANSGYYLVMGCIMFSIGAGVEGDATLAIYKNGSSYFQYQEHIGYGISTTQCSQLISLNAGDTISLYGDIMDGASSPNFLGYTSPQLGTFLSIQNVGVSGNTALTAVLSSATQSISGTVPIAFNTKLFDTLSEFNTSTYTFTAANSGYYLVTYNVTGTVSSVGDNNMGIYIYKNGAIFSSATESVHANDAFASNLQVISLNAGDTISLYAGGTNLSSIQGGTPYQTNISIYRIPYQSNTSVSAYLGSNYGGGSTIPVNTKLFDTLSEFNTSTYTFTAANSGYYLVSASIQGYQMSSHTANWYVMTNSSNTLIVNEKSNWGYSDYQKNVSMCSIIYLSSSSILLLKDASNGDKGGSSPYYTVFHIQNIANFVSASVNTSGLLNFC